jgi:2-oxoisovalerate dehydrogenase E2 component (dihydrolipoyl transacylase)
VSSVGSLQIATPAAPLTVPSVSGADTPARPAPAAPALAGPVDLIPLTQARKIIAQRMVESKHTAPHAWTMVEVDVTNAWKWRLREKDAFERTHGVKLTLLPFFMRAVVESLALFPLMNAAFTPVGLRVHKEINLGMAVAVEGNLLVPVIRSAATLSITGLALAAGAIVARARAGKLGVDDLGGGTFTVNNTGANGSVMSAPILVNGQAGIITMEAVVKRAVVRDDDAIAVRSMMNVCLSLDHRVIDGAIASGFLVDVKRRLEAMGPAGAL